jgi:hypothetical protein
MRATQAWEAHHRAGKTNAVTGRFFQTKPMEELYDTSVDPDNVNNLIDNPQYADVVKRLSKALDRWQLEHHDAGLIPESEMVQRIESSGKTIFDIVRTPSLYDGAALQAAAARAISQDPNQLASLYEDLDAEDSGVRYWAIVGLFNLQHKADIDLDRVRAALDDPSHHVRVMAAWILYRGGDKQTARTAWNTLLRSDSYASLKIFNVVDWIGEGIEPYREAMEACDYDHRGYVDRMKEYLGVAK